MTYWLLATAIGLVVLIVPWFKRTTGAFGKGLMAVVFLVASLCLSLAFVWGSGFLGTAPWYEESPFREILLFVFMGLGMLARMISQAIEERRKYRLKNPGKPAPKLVLDHWELAYPFLSSAICFGALIEASLSSRFDFALALFAFQNGFFWQTVLASAKPT
ncbi:hypothetical protein Q5Y75_26930 [Ruegeria sp. 2205SS24-7]|uniref:hypothetical protein n=1 Tax=Ruegeria discodermiae TaxID=3064389 RepID=UPI0027411C02|nr:hypothetical protein [Ruegeria sp. 2205SS24-7]MDP5220826.1 hypothetical protein [Ruegeria sp. 2205SS24-7]